jgi:hypothetical protein
VFKFFINILIIHINGVQCDIFIHTYTVCTDEIQPLLPTALFPIPCHHYSAFRSTFYVSVWEKTCPQAQDLHGEGWARAPAQPEAGRTTRWLRGGMIYCHREESWEG